MFRNQVFLTARRFSSFLPHAQSVLKDVEPNLEGLRC